MILKNKLEISNSAEIARTEERISKIKAVLLYDNGLRDSCGDGTFQSLAQIHKYLFEDIYDFAGKMRTMNIAKGGFRFAPVMYLCAALENISKMPQSTFDEIIEKICRDECGPSLPGGQWPQYPDLAGCDPQERAGTGH